MKLIGKYLKIFSLLVMLTMPLTNAYAHDNRTLNGTYDLTQEINRLIRATDPSLNIGVQIKSMKYGDEIYTKNQDHSFVPASILKIFTAESALLLLGPDYRFPTSFVTDAKNSDSNIINGNVYLVHSGDPSLTYDDIGDLIDSLKAQNIQQINGNIYIDNTAYDEENYAPGLVWNDKRFCYAAPISASIINHNCMTFHITPSNQIGRAATIDVPSGYYTSLQNNVITRSHRARSCYIRLGQHEGNGLVVSGCMRQGRNSQGVSTVVTDVMRYNRSLLTMLFRHAGIIVNGDIRAGTAPDRAAVLATHQSEPLRNLIITMLKMSDNIIAGSLFKKMGEIYTNRPGSWENGSSAVRQILSRQIGVDLYNMNLSDGSGLSRYNQITPAQMIRVLDFAYHHSTNYEFISALPVAGIDGTLKHRLRNIAWKVRAKTGTMSGVVALAGYVINRNKEPLAFVIIVNGRYGSGWRYRALEDKIVTALTRYSRENA